MNNTDTIALLRSHKPTLTREFGVRKLALFGSTVRNEADADSDVDILVDFAGPAISSRYFGLQFYLEDMLDRPVDLVTDKALRSELRQYVESEAVYV